MAQDFFVSFETERQRKNRSIRCTYSAFKQIVHCHAPVCELLFENLDQSCEECAKQTSVLC
jgi:hypothetical protein